MNFTSFMRLVELPTKVASLLPFIFGNLYALYAFQSFHPFNTIIMFLSVILIDMTTTALNNYMDYKKAFLKEGYGYEIHNAISHYNLKLPVVKHIIIAMLLSATLLGLYLVYLTDFVVLLLGILCFAIGILYTYGPLPISRTPLGEIFSGGTMGFLLTFISIYIHVWDSDLLSLQFHGSQLFFHLNYMKMISLVIVCIPFVLTISNIMLANNICDMEEDLPNKRYTLPIFLGKEKAILVWEISYYFAYIAILIGVFLDYLPLICVVSIVTIIPVKQHIEYFKLKQTKGETFKHSVQNFLLITSSIICALGLDVLVNYFLFKS